MAKPLPENPTPPRSPAPHIDPVFIWPTPSKAEFLFFVERNGDLPENKRWAYGDPYKDAVRYPDHKLVFVSPQSTDKWSRWYYVSDRVNQEDYNWDHSTADLGGRKFNAITRTYFTPRASYDPLAPVPGDAMPDVPASLFSGYIFVAKEQREADENLNPLYVFEVRTYIKRSTITQLGVDTLNGRALSSTETLYYATEVVTGATTAEALFAAPTNTYWGLQTDGTQRSGQQLSDHWYAITSEMIIAGTFSSDEDPDLDGIVEVDEYETTENYYWPPVLNQLEFLDWVRNDGGTDIYPAIRFEPEGYNGPCLATVTRKWRKTAFSDIAVPDQFLPTRVYYASPFFTLNIPECLHVEIFAQCDIGSGDPVYTANSGSKRYFTATNYTVWPNSMTAVDEQAPFRGGFIRTTVEIAKPVAPTSVNWNTGTPP
jgi:hypothetical protein